MGGDLVLLKPLHPGAIAALMKDGANLLDQRFSEIRPWAPNVIGKNCFVWIKCYGVPLHA